MRATRAFAVTATAFAAVGLCAPLAAAGGGDGPRNVHVSPSRVFPGGTLTITVDGCHRGGVVSSNAFPDAVLSRSDRGDRGDRGGRADRNDRDDRDDRDDRGDDGGGGRGGDGDGGRGGDGDGGRGGDGDGGRGGDGGGGRGGDGDGGRGGDGDGGRGGDGDGGRGGDGGGGRGGDGDGGRGGNGDGGRGGNGDGGRGGNGDGGRGGDGGGNRDQFAGTGTATAIARVRNNAAPGSYHLTVRCNDSPRTASASFTVIPGRGAAGGLGGSIGPTTAEMAVGAGLVATAAVGGCIFIARRRRTVSGQA